MTVYYVDGDVGDDANAGTSPGSGNAWATIQKALDTMAAVNPSDTTFVKNTVTYTEALLPTVNGANSGPLSIIGYGTDVHDLGRVTLQPPAGPFGIDHGSAFVGYYQWANFDFDFSNVTVDGFEITSSDDMRFFNCSFSNCGGNAVGNLDARSVFVNCLFENNGGYGAEQSNVGDVSYWGCIFRNNATGSISSIQNINPYTVYRCLFEGNDGPRGGHLAGCTFHSDSGTDAGPITTSTGYGAIWVDNIVSGFEYGLSRTNDNYEEHAVDVNNFIYGYATAAYRSASPVNDWHTIMRNQDTVDEDPRFADIAGSDFTLSGGSPAATSGLVPGLVS